MPNTADIAAQAGVRVRKLEWRGERTGSMFSADLYYINRDRDGFSLSYADMMLSTHGNANAAKAAAQADFEARILAAIEPQAVAETLHGPFGWLNGRRDLSEEHWTLERDPLENSDEHFAIPLFAKVDPFKEAKPDALDRLLNFIVSDDTPVGPEDEENLRLFNAATEEGIAKFALRAAAVSPVTASDERAVEALTLTEIRRRVRNIWGAVSSDQVVDKDVEGQAKRLLADIDTALAAAPKAQPVQGWQTPEGYALVPIEPTEAMLGEADRALALPEDYFRKVYAAMLAAAPLPAGPSSKEGQ